ncbi:MAG: molybdopterin-guanine dinucleotide biosynthesis protein B [Coriobacteriales bacterium]|jgi:molybdopterin-guanine dinucleotide biosynthesis protein MobB/dephospho-CoA kinase
MYTLFLTGGIGSGKSTALAHLRARGADVVDLDEVAHRVLEDDDIKRQLAARFGAQVIGADGRVARPELARRAFADAASTADLDAITHPAILARLDAMFDEAARREDPAAPVRLAVVEVQIAEAAGSGVADEVMTLACPREQRKLRAVTRGMSPQDFDRRDAMQVDDAQRAALADTVIDSSGDPEDLVARLDAWFDARQAAGWRRPARQRRDEGGRFAPGWLSRACAGLPSPALAFVGRHNSGKTTLVVKVIEELVARGVDVGSVKHHGHRGFDIDVEGKDSWRHRHAGASEVAISAPDQFALIRSLDEELTMEQVVRMMRPHEVVLVEGYRHSELPAVEVMRAANERDRLAGEEFVRAVRSGEPFAFDPAELRERLGGDADRQPDERTVAIATDMPRVRRAALECGMRAFGLDCAEEIADFVRGGLGAVDPR